MDLPLNMFRALADPTRLRILALLRSMELSVGELAQVLVQSQPRISRHIKILTDAGLLARRREGAWVFLRLGEDGLIHPLLAAVDAWMAHSPRDPWAVADQARLLAVQTDRARAAAAYFDAQAETWDEMRSLHIAESEVEAAIIALLSPAPLGRLVDIGTGTGRMLELLGGQAEGAIGVDRSPEMLRLARAKLAEAGLEQVELRQGDMYAVSLPDGAADTVVLHQVLHYAQQPEAALAEAARLIAPGGRLLVVDFLPHEREDLRSRHAHARLGFSDAQMAAWFSAAGLTNVGSQALEGGELTVKLWLGARASREAGGII
jgi:DNA-binding transcriptional ArsR family regulator/2-polyprenyl-3-methyl-5-hydroxy-6-metoxy-1,4-benzoquinol methylase